MMKKLCTTFLAFIISIFMSTTMTLACDAHAQEAEGTTSPNQYESSNLIINNSFIRYNVGKVTGAFFTIENKSTQDEKLIKAESEISELTEIHNHINENGVMKMRKIDDITIPAQSTFYLKPGAHHIMLINLTSDLILGDIVNIKLTFENEGEITVPFKIQHVGSMKHNHDSQN